MKNNPYNKKKYYSEDVKFMIEEKRSSNYKKAKHKNICDTHEDGA